MGDTWIVDLRQYLTHSGAVAEDLPSRARILAQFWTQIVSQATLYDEPTTLQCRRRPGRRACGGLLYITFDETLEVVLWHCPKCQDNGAIRGWQGTFWDHGDLPDDFSSGKRVEGVAG